MVMRGIVLALAVFGAVAADAAVRAELSRSTVPITDSFRITYTVDGQAPRPDFSPLQRDFEVLSTAQSTSVNIVDQSMRQSTSWTIDLMARREGELTIPPIDFSGQRSEALTVTITAADDNTAVADQEIFIEVEAEPAEPYVQAQVRFTLRIFRAVPVSGASLSELQIVEGDAIVERAGEDLVYETTRGGARFSVVERRYAIFPQSSGRLVIGPMTFAAYVGASQRPLFDPRPRGRRVRVRSEAMELDVKPIPESFTASAWLPAERVELTEDWPGGDNAQWRVGEPLTRTLTLRARGLAASQLAEIGATVPEQIKQYADQPEFDEAAIDGSLVAVRRETIAMIPSQPGRFELPAVAVPWWNTLEDRLEYARVPARSVTVTGPAGTTDRAAPVAPASPPAAQAVQNDIVTPPGPPAGGAGLWRWLSILLALGWLTTALSWIATRRRHAGAKAPRESARGPGPKAAIGKLKQACASDDTEAATQALLRWGALQWPGNPVRSLGELAARLDGDFQAQVHRLSRARYSPDGERWTGAALWQAFQTSRNRPHSRTARADSPELEPLYR